MAAAQRDETNKDMSLCLTRSKFNPVMLQSEIQGLECIYCAEYQGAYGSGYLLALFHSNPRKKHSTLDNNIANLDRMITSLNGDTQCNFISISDQLSGKVRTFGRGERKHDELFRHIFDVSKPGEDGRKFAVNAGVEIWTGGEGGYQGVAKSSPERTSDSRPVDMCQKNEVADEAQKVMAFIPYDTTTTN